MSVYQFRMDFKTDVRLQIAAQRERAFWPQLVAHLASALLQGFPTVLLQLIATYCDSLRWEFSHLWRIPYENLPYGLTSDNNNRLFVLVGTPTDQKIYTYTLDGTLLDKSDRSHIVDSLAIDCYRDHLYVRTWDLQLSILNLQKRLVSTWPLAELTPSASYLLRGGTNRMRGIKVDNYLIYLTFENDQYIYIYNQQGEFRAKFLSTIDSPPQKQSRSFLRDAEYPSIIVTTSRFEPCGLTVDSKNIYCCGDHKIQILDKNDGKGIDKWEGFFFHPFVINCLENLFYIGDQSSIQIFNAEGFPLGIKLGEKYNWEWSGARELQFDMIRGISVVKDKLFVSDLSNGRIKVYRLVISDVLQAGKDE